MEIGKALRCLGFDRLGMMVRRRELMVIVKRCSFSLLAAREEGGNKKGRWEKRSGSCVFQDLERKGIEIKSFWCKHPSFYIQCCKSVFFVSPPPFLAWVARIYLCACVSQFC